uniref:Retrotransposon gag domain-containing protein n=1 Tax=Vitis vinifera TaxID=29760 RepID=A5ARL8_VITVI|nr:hypothetical protein VITISV_014722 [Vitis vinifera]
MKNFQRIALQTIAIPLLAGRKLTILQMTKLRVKQSWDTLWAPKDWYRNQIHASPIAPHLLQEELLAHYLDLKKFKLYDGMEDPVEHLYCYWQLMALKGNREGLLRRVFPASLQGFALIWFQQLPTQSIHSFTQLHDLFLKQYVCNSRPRKSVDYVFNLRSLAKRNLSTMDELLAQANRYANMKEELRVIGNKQKIDGAKSRMAKEEQEDLSTTLK